MFRVAVIAVLQFVIAASTQADEALVVTGSADRIAAQNWLIGGFASTLELTEAGLRGEFRLASIVLPASGDEFEDVRVTCNSITLTTHAVRCGQGIFTASLPGIGRQAIPGSFTYNHHAGIADIELARVAVAGGRARLNINASDAGINVRYSGNRLQLAGLLELAARYSNAFTGYVADGVTDIAGTVTMAAGRPPRIVLAADLDGVLLANEAGTIAADGVAGKLRLDVTLGSDATRFTLGIDTGQGEAYLEPYYANFSESPLTLQANDVSTRDFTTFRVAGIQVRQQGLLDMQGSVTLRFPSDELPATGVTAEVELRNSSIENLYANLLRVAAAGTILGNLDTDGTVSGSVSIVDSSLRSATVTLDDAIFDDRRGRFAAYGIKGGIDWSADPGYTPGTSRLSWESGSIYNIGIGGGTVELQLGDDDVEMLAPLRVPMLGGALLIQQLALKDFGSENATGTLDAELEPVQLGQLTGTFGWPAFSGRLSGRLPLLQLAENTITVGGTLSARAFDGTMEISNLRIEQPFGLVPRLQCDVAIRNLDLQLVTEAYSFGLIQGRLSGDIAGLIMEKWRPVAMDMSFYTSRGDRSPHRISQRAVENLASVGGGATAVLSTGLLKFFEVFSYDRIGLRCLLKDDVCTMSGVGPAAGGYYLVKGRGVPRIDVVGIRESVSWSRLVKQLATITRGGTPTVN